MLDVLEGFASVVTSSVAFSASVVVGVLITPMPTTSSSPYYSNDTCAIEAAFGEPQVMEMRIPKEIVSKKNRQKE